MAMSTSIDMRMCRRAGYLLDHPDLSAGPAQLKCECDRLSCRVRGVSSRPEQWRPPRAQHNIRPDLDLSDTACQMHHRECAHLQGYVPGARVSTVTTTSAARQFSSPVIS